MKWTLIGSMSLAIAASASADVGPAWVEPEEDDAGDSPKSAEFTSSPNQQMLFISGSLDGITGSGPMPDLQDMFVVCIDDPESFKATLLLPGFAEGFDPRLYLFSLSGDGLLANDDSLIFPAAAIDLAGGGGIVVPESTICNFSNDGTDVEISLSGLYLLAVTTGPFIPNGGDGPIFDFQSSIEFSGPDGPSKGGQIDGWKEGPDLLGACCVAGECFPATAFECYEDLGGDTFFPDVTCAEVSCPLLMGACCIKGSCVDTDEPSCMKSGGTFFPGEFCFDGKDGFICPGAFGACCFDGTCFDTTKLDCNESGGQFFIGDSCSGFSCPPPIFGACCLGGGKCFETTQHDCIGKSGGDFFPDEICFDGKMGVICPQPVGACCFDDGTCADGIDLETCFGALGFFDGDGTTCDSTVCGACIFGEFSCDVVSETFCADSEGDFQGEGEICPTSPAPPGPVMAGEYQISLEGCCFANQVPTGACELPDGECVETDEYSCAIIFQGLYLGDGTYCCPGDVNRDGVVDVQDQTSVILNWGPCGDCPQDIDGDGQAGVSDLTIVILNWGPCD